MTGLTLQKSNNDGSATCMLCPHMCHLKINEEGKCRARVNSRGTIISTTYGKVSSLGVDPIEKKPLYHFFPGRKILSIGSWGCNFNCSFCQNHTISQSGPAQGSEILMPEAIVGEAVRRENNLGIAFTYNEPLIGFEFMMDTSLAAADKGLRNVVVTNGYINPSPLRSLTRVIDAWNIDLKSFNDKFYKEHTGGTLAPVLKSIAIVAESGNHLEITTLIIPGLNDTTVEIRELAGWIAKAAGRSTPLHLSRYFPQHRSVIPPTPTGKMAELVNEARKKLDYVYTGNISLPAGGDTVCPSCGTIVTTRDGYKTEHPALGQDGRCNKCNYLIYKYI